MDPETLEMARIVRMERSEEPLNVPESIEIAILQESVRFIDVYLAYYKDGLDGTDFRYMKRGDVKTINKVKSDRQQIIQDAAEQLEWILSDEIPMGAGAGVTFREVCDATGITHIPSFRKTLLGSIFHGVHPNAFTTLSKYIEWKEQSEYANSYNERPNHSASRRLQAQHS